MSNIITCPLWVYILVGALFILVGYVGGVVDCYKHTTRIGDIILTPDPESGDLYMFLELNKPIAAMQDDLTNGKEVLATIRVKNSQ